MKIVDRTGTGTGTGAGVADLEAELGGAATLAEVLRWSFAAGRELAAVVTQDEYTHDVIFPWRDRRWLAFDTT
jgi:hypothetical protein